MKSFLTSFSFIVLLSCSNPQNEHPSISNTSKTLTDPNSEKYNKLIDGLKQDYVSYYSKVKSFGGDLAEWGMPDNDSLFRLDSIRYSESCQEFFIQDGNFVTWLLNFKYDTTNSGLWKMYHNPLSSYLSECNLSGLNNSRAAIILLENFLIGKGFRCFECKYDNRKDCNLNKYLEIETFLFANKEKGIAELRKAWQKKNDR